MTKKILQIILFVFSLWPVSIIAQNSNFEYFDLDNIRSRELIKDICKDHLGYIWLASDNGVLKYDGIDTRIYYRQIPSPFTKAFLKRKNGQLLVLHDFGIKEIISRSDTTEFRDFMYNDKTFTETLNYPKSIYEDKNGTIWIGEIDAIVKIDDSGTKRYPLGSEYLSISYHKSFSFTEDAFGNLWVAPYKGSLLSYNPRSDEFIKITTDISITEKSDIINVKGDYLFIGAKEGILQLKVDSDKNILNSELIHDVIHVSSLFNYSDNQIYIGTWYYGMYYLNIESNSVKKITNIPYNDILNFYFDGKANEIWIAGSENIGLFKPTMIHPINYSNAFRIESIGIDFANDITYFSTGHKIYKFHNATPADYEEVLTANNTYFDFIIPENKNLWIGSAFGGIYRYNTEDKTTKTFQKNTNIAIKHIFIDKQGNKWFSGHDSQITRIDKNDSIHIYSGVINSKVITQSHDSIIYCGSEGINNLLYRYDPVKNTFLPLSLNFRFNVTESITIEDMCFDENDRLYIASNEGLLTINDLKGTSEAERIQLNGFDNDESFRAIAITGDIIWLASSYGLILYRNDEAVLQSSEKELPSRILKERGLITTRDHHLLIATAKGIAMAEPKIIQFRNTPPPVLKSLYINGKKISCADTVQYHFPYHTRMLAEFINLSYPGSDIIYQTRILGLDNNWSKASKTKNISIMGFQEGSYSLEVRARKGGSVWSEPLSIHFTIESPWFKAWWVYFLFIVILIIFTLIVVKLYNIHLIRQKRNLRKIIEDRTREINRQKNEIIEHKNKIIKQKEELLEKNKIVYESNQALSEADLKYLHLKEKQLQDQIEYKNKQITTHTLNIIQKNEMLKDLRDKLEEFTKKAEKSESVNDVKKILRMIDESFRVDKDWNEFKLYFEQIYTGFYAKLKVNYPNITTQELRHCALIRLNLTINECASILGISHDSVKVSRTRLRKKLNLTPSQNLTDFIMSV